jgi:hypothetical protein
MKETLKKLFQLTKNYPLIATILLATGHFLVGHFMFGDKVTNIYDLFDEWYFSILIFYAIFLAFIITLNFKLNKALARLKEFEEKETPTDEPDKPAE